jgi:multidrug efflux pump subunit AcrA (membrane-fusion protein)
MPEPSTSFPKKNNKLLALGIAGALVIAVAAAAAYAFAGWDRSPQRPAATLAKGPIERIAEADGVVESAHKAEVYAPSGMKVRAVYVHEGDAVQAGSALADLDTEALELEILRAELNIQNAEANLTNEQVALVNAITGARNGLETASASVRAAQREYDALMAQQGQELTVIAAAINLDTARRGWEYYKALYDELQSVSYEALTQAKDAYDKAQSAYDDAVRGASDAIDRAQEALDTAVLRQQNAENVLSDAISKNTNPAAVALELQKVALDEKRIRLRDAHIAAPAEGRVTLVSAKAGAPASGLMFVIEDDSRLIVRTRAEEADIADIALGTACRIQPAGREWGLTGTVALLPPAAERDDAGVFMAAVGDDVFFVVDVAIDSPHAGVLIGMNAKVSFVIDAREDCFYAPRSLVNRDGDYAWVIALDRAGRIVDVPVEVGLQTGRVTEIMSDALYEGMELFSR